MYLDHYLTARLYCSYPFTYFPCFFNFNILFINLSTSVEFEATSTASILVFFSKKFFLKKIILLYNFTSPSRMPGLVPFWVRVLFVLLSFILVFFLFFCLGCCCFWWWCLLFWPAECGQHGGPIRFKNPSHLQFLFPFLHLLLDSYIGFSTWYLVLDGYIGYI